MINHTKQFHFLPLLILSLGAALSQAQSLSQTVIGNAGNYQSNAAIGSLHWTVGEVAVESFDHNTASLSQGFHQMYNTLINPVWEIKTELELKLFPNPTIGWIRLENKNQVPLNVMITNLLGQKMHSASTNQTQTDFDLHSFPNGLYLFSVFHKGQIIKSFKVNKQGEGI